MWGEWAAFAPTQLLGSGPTESDLLEQEKESSRMLHAMRNDHALSTLILQTVAHDPADQFEHCLLLPQNVTLGDVSITQEFVETHLVQLQRAPRGQPRSFTSLNGLCGTCQPDNTFVVHARLRQAKDGADVGSSIGGWQQDQSRGTGTIPQLESTIYILRDGQLQATSELPLSSPIALLLISDPLFFPGCGWKLPLALRKCTHRFRDVNVTDLALADLPQLLFEYQILARAWLEHRGDPITSSVPKLNVFQTEIGPIGLNSALQK
ncbi:hypothetical protein AB1Y20_000804 [Prymnesium parvum]|uniref:Uncharacterized protein n=1 Tax=Prymnesium parvum TaxID=97485 RepID=A0AB34K5Y7_PRYPA